MKARTRRKKTIILLAVLAASLAVAGIALVPLSAYLSRRMDVFKEKIIEEIEARLACDISYLSISPSFLRSLEIRGISLRQRGGERVMATAERVGVSFRIDKLLKADFSDSVREVRLLGVSADIDRRADAAFIQAIASLAGEPQGEGAAPSSLGIKLRDAAISYRDGPLLASLAGLSADLALGAAGISGSIKSSAELKGTGLTGLDALNFVLNASGNASSDLNNARVALNLGFSSGSFSLARQSFIVTKRGDSIQATKVENRAPLDASASLDLGTKKYRVDVVLDDFVLGILGTLKGDFAAYAPWLKARGTGKAWLEGSLGSGGAEYAVTGMIVPPESLSRGYALDIDAKGNGSRLEVNRAHLHGTGGEASFAGSIDLVKLKPEGRLSIDLSASGVPIKGEWELWSEGQYLTLFSDALSLGDQEFKSVSAALLAQAKSWDFSLTAYLPASDYQAATAGAFTGEAMGPAVEAPLNVKGSLTLAPKPFVDAEIILTGVRSRVLWSLASIFGPLPSGSVADFASQFTLSAEVYVSTDFASSSYYAPQVVASYNKKPGNYGVFSLSGNAGAIDLSKISVFWDGYSALGNLSIDFGASDLIGFQAAMTVGGIPYKASGEIADGKQLSARGDYGLEAHASFAGRDTLFTLAFRELPLPLKGNTPRLSLSASGRIRGAGDYSVLIDSSRFEQTGLFLPAWASIEAEGTVEPGVARLTAIKFEDQFSILNGSGEIGFAAASPLALEVDLELASGTGEYYTAAGSYAGGKMSGKGSARDAPTNRFGDFPVKGLVSGDFSVDGSLSDPALGFAASLSKASYLGLPLSAKASGAYRDRRLDLKNTEIGFYIFSLKNGSGSYDRDRDLFALKGTLGASLGNNAFKADLSGSGSILRDGALSPKVSGSLAKLSFGELSAELWPFAASMGKDGFSFAGGSASELSLSLKPDGRLSIKAKRPFFIQGNGDGTLGSKGIDAVIPDFALDLPQIWRLFGNPMATFRTGKVSAALSVKGGLSDPSISGTGRVDGLTCAVPTFVTEEYGPVSAAFTVNDNALSLPETLAKSASSSILVSMSMDFERWLPAAVRLRIKTPAASTIAAKTYITGLDVEGRARLDLALGILSSNLDLRGFIVLDEGSIVLSKGPQQTATANPNSGKDYPFIVNLGLGYGRKVEFLWPSRTFPVIRSTFDPSPTALSVAWDGRKESWSLKGQAKMRSGEVFYVKRSFYLKEGLIAFNETEDFFDPLVTVRAEMRDSDATGPVTIILRVDKMRLSQWKPRYEALPARSEAEILSMLGVDLIGGSGQAAAGLSGDQKIGYGVLSLVDSAAQTALLRQFEGNVRDFTGLDMFSVRSPLLQNLILGATLPVDRASGLGNYFDGTTMTAGKYLGADLFFQGMLQMQNNPVSGNFQFNPELSLEWNTPFFRMLWNLAPSLSGLQGMSGSDLIKDFVGNQSIGVFVTIPY